MNTVVVDPVKTVAQLEPVDTSQAEEYEAGFRLAREAYAFRRLGTIGYDAYLNWVKDLSANRPENFQSHSKALPPHRKSETGLLSTYPIR